jgi:hypothetical protein
MSIIRTALVAGWILLLVPAALAGDLSPRERAILGQEALPFGDTGQLSAPSPPRGIEDQQQIIEHQLDTTESRVLRRSARPLERQQVQRDLGTAAHDIDTFKTVHPNARATPLFENQLNRLERPARIREPGPPTLLDQAPTLLEQR